MFGDCTDTSCTRCKRKATCPSTRQFWGRRYPRLELVLPVLRGAWEGWGGGYITSILICRLGGFATDPPAWVNVEIAVTIIHHQGDHVHGILVG